MEVGRLNPSDAAFRAVCMLLAQHPLYGGVALNRLVSLFESVMREQGYVILDEGKVCGVLLWKELSDDAARESIAKRLLPPAHLSRGSGEAVLATAFLGPDLESATLLWKHFLAANRGRIILYERHRPGKKAPSVFKWVDKSGRVMGKDL